MRKLTALDRLLFILLFALTIVLFKQDVFAAPSLQTNNKGEYCINNAEDYYSFIKDVHNEEIYEGKKIILTDDISVDALDLVGWHHFRGTIDGQNHEIEYSSDNKCDAPMVFPFYIENGLIKNLNINVHEKLYINNTNNSATTFNHWVIGGLKDSKLENVQLYGDVSFVYNQLNTTVNICAIGGSGDFEINNCRVSLKYDYDNLNSDQTTFNFEKNWTINLSIINMTSPSGNVKINNFYSNSTYSKNVADLANYIGENIKSTKTQGMALKWISNVDLSPENVNGIYFDKDSFPELFKTTQKRQNAISKYTFANNDSFGKSTADMKLQSTFTGFDFDNVWAISDKVNDGYPFILAEAVKEVNKLIADLPAKITADQKAAVEAARAAYDALSDSQKIQVSDDTLKKLTDAEAALKPAETKPAAAVKKGDKFVVGANRYQALSAKTVAFIGTRKKTVKKVGIPASVTYKKQKLTVTAIGKGACKGYKKLKAVTIGKNVTIIGAKAFAGDSKLKKIKVQSPVLKKVGAKAFKGINKKAVIKVPKKQRKKFKKLMKGKGQKKTVKIK